MHVRTDPKLHISFPHSAYSERGNIQTFAENATSPIDAYVTTEPLLLSYTAQIVFAPVVQEQARTLHVGARSFTRLPQQVITPWDISREGLEVFDSIMEFARRYPELLITIDLNVLENKTYPSGLSVRELMYFVQRLSFLKQKKVYHIITNEETKHLVVKILTEA